jgi:integrase
MSVFRNKIHGKHYWVVQIYRNGKPHHFYKDPKTGAPLKSYAEAKAAEADALIEKDTLLSGKAKTRVSDLSAAFLAEYQKTHKPSSVYSRWNQMKNHILPAMGNYTVEKLTNDDLDCINERLNKGPKTSLGGVISAARGFIRFLRRYNATLLPERIYAFLDPYPHTHQYNVWTLEQERKFLSVITDPRDKLLFTLFCEYGFRMTECIALKYSDIDVQNMTISINRIVLTKSMFKRQIFTTPKTKRSIRTLRLLPDIIPLLNPEARQSDFLFPGEYGAYVINEGHVRRLVVKYANMASLKPIRVHEFRHSCASNLLRGMVPLRIVAHWLGDTEATVLAYYSHMFPDESGDVAKFFAANPLRPGQVIDEKKDTKLIAPPDSGDDGPEM